LLTPFVLALQTPQMLVGLGLAVSLLLSVGGAVEVSDVASEPAVIASVQEPRIDNGEFEWYGKERDRFNLAAWALAEAVERHPVELRWTNVVHDVQPIPEGPRQGMTQPHALHASHDSDQTDETPRASTAHPAHVHDESRFVPDGWSVTGFLSPGETVASVQAKDDATLKRLGLTHAQFASAVEELILSTAMCEQLCHDFDGYREAGTPACECTGWRKGVIKYGRFKGVEVEYVSHRGIQLCPFSESLENSLGSVNVCGRSSGQVRVFGDTPMTVSELMPHLIRDHHFFEGSVPYRVDPEAFARLAGLVPAPAAEPKRDDFVSLSNAALQWSLLPSETREAIDRLMADLKRPAPPANDMLATARYYAEQSRVLAESAKLMFDQPGLATLEPNAGKPSEPSAHKPTECRCGYNSRAEADLKLALDAGDGMMRKVLELSDDRTTGRHSFTLLTIGIVLKWRFMEARAALEEITAARESRVARPERPPSTMTIAQQNKFYQQALDTAAMWEETSKESAAALERKLETLKERERKQQPHAEL
jgi:hypothetical protein